VERLSQAEIFENLLELNQTSLPKEKLFLVTYSKSMKIHKKIWRPGNIFSQTELYNTVSRLLRFLQN
jgi:hypothetical protein